jgi:predicted nucleic acid-binding protein
VIIDSDVIIEILRGNSRTAAWLRNQRAQGTSLRYSPVSRAEIRAGTRPKERAVISALFDGLTLLPVEGTTGDLAGDQMARFAGSHHVQLGDSLIAAAALEHGDALATFNIKHFPGIKRIVTPDR